MKVRFKSPSIDHFIEQYSVNISHDGVFIRSPNPMPVGTLLKFEFQLEDRSRLIHGVGRVVWIREATSDLPPHLEPGMGIKFIKMDKESRKLVDSIITNRNGGRGAFESGVAPEEDELPEHYDDLRNVPIPSIQAAPPNKGALAASPTQVKNRAPVERKPAATTTRTPATTTTRSQDKSARSPNKTIQMPALAARQMIAPKGAGGSTLKGPQALVQSAQQSDELANAPTIVRPQQRAAAPGAAAMTPATSTPQNLSPIQAPVQQATPATTEHAAIQNDEPSTARSFPPVAPEEPQEALAHEQPIDNPYDNEAKPDAQPDGTQVEAQQAQTETPHEQAEPAARIPTGAPIEETRSVIRMPQPAPDWVHPEDDIPKQKSSTKMILGIGGALALVAALLYVFVADPLGLGLFGNSSEEPEEDSLAANDPPSNPEAEAQPAAAEATPKPEESAAAAPAGEQAEEPEAAAIDPNIPSLLIQSEPAGATVNVNGEDKGITPLNFALPEARRLQVKISLAGYQTIRRTLRNKGKTMEPMNVTMKGLPFVLDVLTLPKNLKVKAGSYKFRTPGRATFKAEELPVTVTILGNDGRTVSRRFAASDFSEQSKNMYNRFAVRMDGSSNDSGSNGETATEENDTDTPAADAATDTSAAEDAPAEAAPSDTAPPAAEPSPAEAAPSDTP